MKRSNLYIATLLITAVLLGTCVVPLVHAVDHYIEDAHHHSSDTHEHPDYAAWLDASYHLVDTDLDCILCSSTGLDVFKLSARVFEQLQVYHLQATYSLFVFESFITSQGIRGPPALW